MTSADQDWTEADLRARCERARESLQVRGLATPEEIAGYWPGGEENEATGLGGWVMCFANYLRLLDRISPQARADRAAEAERIQLAALQRQPQRVELVSRTAEDQPRYLNVYPKAAHALWHLAGRDRVLAQCAGMVERLKLLPDSETVALFPELFREIDYQQRVVVWILTTAGPGLPFPEEEPHPVPPAYVAELDAYDLVRLLRAHHQVNAGRLAVLQDVGGLSDGVRRPSWEVSSLAAQAAVELHTPADVLLRSVPLTQWVTQLHLVSRAREAAREGASRPARPAGPRPTMAAV